MSKVQICKLCEAKEASSIKSHIFSHFFIKSMINPISDNKRGIGRSFQMSGTGGTKTFFERNVSMKDYDRLFGHADLTDEQLTELRMDPYSEPFILCSRCEKRMGIVEDYFNDNVFYTLFEDEKVNNAISACSHNSDLIKLFFLSMIWRASIAEFDNFKIDAEIENRLKEILNTSIGDDLDSTIELVEQNKDEIKKEGVCCITSRVFCDVTANQILIENCTNPYFFEINEYSVCYFGTSEDHAIQEDLFGLESHINEETINQNEDEFKIAIISNQEWNIKRNRIMQKKAIEFIQHVKQKLVNNYFDRNKKAPKEQIIQAFGHELIHGRGTTLALRYSDDRIEHLIAKYIKYDA